MTVRKEPNYLFFTISLLAAVVLITGTHPENLLVMTLGISIAVLSFMVISYIVIESRFQLLLAALLAVSAFLPFMWLIRQPEAQSPSLVQALYVLNILMWLLFTLYIAVVVFRGIMSARRIGSNEIYGAIYVYLLIGVVFAEIYQLLLAWQPDALFFDPGRFPKPLAISNNSLLTRGAGDLLYYSFVTLGTVGYGDVTPASPFARSLSLIEAVAGIMYVATMIARFVSIQTSAEVRGVEAETANATPSSGNESGVKSAAHADGEGP
jgi:hypothetical protein